MSLLRRRSRPLLAGAAFAVLALVLSACLGYKPGSFSLSQPAGIGSVRLHFVACEELQDEKCVENMSEAEGQALIAISVPKGAGAPPTVTAVPTPGGPAVVLTRNDQVAQAVSEASQESGKPWPPAGTEGVGYISSPVKQEKGLREWTVDLDLTLPTAAEGGPFAGPFPVSLWIGSRFTGPAEPADRPVECTLPEDPIGTGEARCAFADEGSLGTSDLKMTAAPEIPASRGGKAALSFPLDFASSASSLPSFNLAATSTLPGAKLTLANPIFSPGAPDASHRSPLAFGTVNVAVPKNAKPGVYDVTLTATSATGGSVSQMASLSQVAKLRVIKPVLRLGKVKLNKAKGTAVLFVKVPAAGVLTVSGKGLAKAKRKARAPKTLKVPIKPKGKAKGLLAELGKAKVKAKVTFKPTGAAAVVKSKSIVLKKS